MTITKANPLIEIVTVTSRDYLPGTHVMLHSFLKTNPWFNGNISIFQDDLEVSDKAALSASFSHVDFPEISPDLATSIDSLVKAVPKLANRRRRFLSLEAFSSARSTFDNTGKVLFCDGDLLFRGDVTPMIEMNGSITACGDRAQIVGTGRHPISLQEFGNQNAKDGFASFNAGLMVLSPETRTKAIWDGLLAQLSGERWQDIASDHTDQAVYNRVFGHQITLADPAFNYLVGHAGALRTTAEMPMKNAKVLHFNGPQKPWRFGSHLDRATNASFVKASQHWFAAYSEFLSAHHFALK